jgi:hypothetical protein
VTVFLAHQEIQDLRTQCAKAQDELCKAQAIAAAERRKQHQLSVALAKQQEEANHMRDAIKAEKTLVQHFLVYI